MRPSKIGDRALAGLRPTSGSPVPGTRSSDARHRIEHAAAVRLGQRHALRIGTRAAARRSNSFTSPALSVMRISSVFLSVVMLDANSSPAPACRRPWCRATRWCPGRSRTRCSRPAVAPLAAAVNWSSAMSIDPGALADRHAGERHLVAGVEPALGAGARRTGMTCARQASAIADGQSHGEPQTTISTLLERRLVAASACRAGHAPDQGHRGGPHGDYPRSRRRISRFYDGSGCAVRARLDASGPRHYTSAVHQERQFRAPPRRRANAEGFVMSRRCELTGKGAQVGHKVSHSNIKTKRRFLPNLLNVTLMSDALGRSVQAAGLGQCAQDRRSSRRARRLPDEGEGRRASPQGAASSSARSRRRRPRRAEPAHAARQLSLRLIPGHSNMRPWFETRSGGPLLTMMSILAALFNKPAHPEGARASARLEGWPPAWLLASVNCSSSVRCSAEKLSSEISVSTSSPSAARCTDRPSMLSI